jgi:hypothetical protein
MKAQQHVRHGRRPFAAVLSSVVFGACFVAALVGLISGTGLLGHGPASAAAPGAVRPPGNGAPAARVPSDVKIAPASVDDPIDPQQLNYVDIQG